MAVTESLKRTYVESDGLALAELVRKGEVQAIELVEAAASVIEELNPKLNAVIHKLYDMGREAAGSVDKDALFAGVPYVLKELATSWKGAPNTNSSFYLKDVVADQERRQGVVFQAGMQPQAADHPHTVRIRRGLRRKGRRRKAQAQEDDATDPMRQDPVPRNG